MDGEHQSYILTVAFSRDGRKILTGDDDGSVRLRNIDNGVELSRSVERGPVRRAKFIGSGRQYLTVSDQRNSMSENLWVARHVHEADDLISDLCARVIRPLSVDEWILYVSKDIPYECKCSTYKRWP